MGAAEFLKVVRAVKGVKSDVLDGNDQKGYVRLQEVPWRIAAPQQHLGLA